VTGGVPGAIRSRPIVAVVVAFALGVVAVGSVWAAVAVVGLTEEPRADPVHTSEPVDDPTHQPIGDSVAASACPDATTTVHDAASLQKAIDAAQPGDLIALVSGNYVGNFVARVSGTAERPITLCGSVDSVLDGGGVDDGYVLHLDGAAYWHLVGFTVTNGQKGVMADGTVGSVIEDLTVHTIGDEAIHLRRMSTDNTVIGNQVSNTGLRRAKYGEGIYVGTAESNWCDITACQPDTSDRNLIQGNTIWATTAESVDIKEGTSNGVVRGNTFDGARLVEDDADSWVDVKGNAWLIAGNVGTNSPRDGFQTHEILDGWGTRNVFRSNVANVNGPGFGFSLTPARDNVVACDNQASAAGEGLTNVTCIG
jgi:hypothetical protein